MKWLSTYWPLGMIFFAALPATSNYQLNSYGFGSGGVSNASTSTYSLEGTAAELSGQTGATANYSLKPGFIETQQANVPKLVSLSNGGNTFYNKLTFVIDRQSNPTDTLYALSISTDNFVSDTRYVKSDMTVGATLALADYQTYASFGSASGATIIGLTAGTSYSVRVKATQGKFTESAYGPTTTTATVGAQLSFSVSTNAVSLGALYPGITTDGSQTVNVTFATNAVSGGDVYISGKNAGLLSASKSTTIPSLSGDLSGFSRGYGVQVSSIAATTGTFTKLSPYDGIGAVVGITDTIIRRIMTAPGPVVGGSGSLTIKAKASSADTAANDYTETNTMLASAGF